MARTMGGAERAAVAILTNAYQTVRSGDLADWLQGVISDADYSEHLPQDAAREILRESTDWAVLALGTEVVALRNIEIRDPELIQTYEDELIRRIGRHTQLIADVWAGRLRDLKEGL